MNSTPQTDTPEASRLRWILVGSFAILLGAICLLYMDTITPPDRSRYEVRLDRFYKGKVESPIELKESWREVQITWEAASLLEKEAFNPSKFTSFPEWKTHLEKADREFSQAFWNFVKVLTRGDGLPWDEADLVPALEILYKGNKLLNSDIRRDHLEERPEEALAKGALQLRMANALNYEHPMLFQVGTLFEESGITNVVRSLSSFDAGSDALHELSLILHAVESDTSRLRQCVKLAFGPTISFIRKTPVEDLLPGMMNSKTGARMREVYLTLADVALFKRHRTMFELVQAMEEIDLASQKSTFDGWNKVKQLHEERRRMLVTTGWKSWLNPNCTGQEVVLLVLENSEEDVAQFLYRLVLRRCLNVALALRSFEFEKGHLPDRLETLVPRHLAEMPIDPVSGQPLNWVRETGRIYSNGLDAIDDGGIYAPERGIEHQKDWGILYPWWNKDQQR